MGGPVRKLEIPVAIVSFLVSLSIVVFVLLGSEGPRRAGVTVFEEDALPSKYLPRDEEAEPPIWLSDYSSHVPLIGVFAALPSADLNPVEDRLMDSLSPGVRAHYEGARLAREAARKRGHEREEAEYAAFIEERIRRKGK